MSEHLIEGLKSIAEYLGVTAPTDEALRKRIRGWVREDGLPVSVIRGRYFALPSQLEAWKNDRRAA